MNKVKKTVDKKPETTEKNEDCPLGFCIKRIEHKYIEHKSKLLPNGSVRCAILGTSGCGKSTLLLSLIPMFSNLTKKLIYCSIKEKDDAQTSIKLWCEEQGIEYIKCMNEEEAMTEIESLISSKEDNEHDIIVFDDFSLDNGGSVNKVGSANNIMTICSQVLRSYQISMIFITQTYYNLPTRLRENLNLTFVFQMKNKYSIDAWLQDTLSQYYDGSNEDKIKQDLKDIYKRVFEDKHKWLLCTSNPSQIRMGWNSVVYPPDQVGQIEGGKAKRKLNDGAKKRQELVREARKLGLPSWKSTSINVEQLNQFINAIKNKNKDEINKVLSSDYETTTQLYKRFLYYVRQYKENGYPKSLDKIGEYCNLLLDRDFDINKLQSILNKNHLSECFDLE